LIDEQVLKVRRILEVAAEVLPKGRREACDVRIPLSGGTVLTGTLGGIEEGVLGTVTLSKVKPKQRLSAWVRLLALTVSRPEVPWEAITIGQGEKRGRICIARMGELGDDAEDRRTRALANLEVIVDLYRRGMREPLPIFCGASAAYFNALGTDRDPFAAAASKFDSGFNFSGEIEDAEHRFVYGSIGSMYDLEDLERRSEESGAGWSNTEETRIGVLAHRLWHLPSKQESMREV
jgi:exodeoxyribonuclease V gamma subunit